MDCREECWREPRVAGWPRRRTFNCLPVKSESIIIRRGPFGWFGRHRARGHLDQIALVIGHGLQLQFKHVKFITAFGNRPDQADVTCSNNSIFHQASWNHVAPLARRVGVVYSERAAGSLAVGIGVPISLGAARAPRPVWARLSYGRARREHRKVRRYQESGTPIVARPATSIGVRVVGLTLGDRQ